MSKNDKWTFLTASMESRRSVPELEALVERIQPEVVNLSQAYNVKQWAQQIVGYHFHQGFGVFNREAKAVGVLVRGDVDWSRSRHLRMHARWTGPKSGLKHKPRIYPAGTLSRDDVSCHLIGMHAPTHNNPGAQAETWRHLNNYAENHPHQPTFVLGDFNEEARDLAEKLPHYRVAPGTKVDHCAVSDRPSSDPRLISVHRYEVPPGLHGFVAFTFQMA